MSIITQVRIDVTFCSVSPRVTLLSVFPCESHRYTISGTHTIRKGTAKKRVTVGLKVHLVETVKIHAFECWQKHVLANAGNVFLLR